MMKKHTLFCLLAVIAMSLGACALRGKTAPKISSELRLEIREAERPVLKLGSEISSLIQRYNTINPQFQEANRALSELIDRAYEEAGVSKEKWDFNLDTMEFTEKAANPPAPPEQSAKPKDK